MSSKDNLPTTQQISFVTVSERSVPVHPSLEDGEQEAALSQPQSLCESDLNAIMMEVMNEKAAEKQAARDAENTFMKEARMRQMDLAVLGTV